jgi:hypothetical protein
LESGLLARIYEQFVISDKHRDIFWSGFVRFEIIDALDFFSMEGKTVILFSSKHFFKCLRQATESYKHLLGSSENAKLVENAIAKSPQSLEPLAWRWQVAIMYN